MSAELVILALTAALAVVAVIAALIALRVARRAAPAAVVDPTPTELESQRPEATVPAAAGPDSLATEAVRIVEGRVIVTPTTRQIVEATMGRPFVRISVLSHGLAHALRPESRDRIAALMRREFRSRRRQRKLAAKRAARMLVPTTRPTPAQEITSTESWLGELPEVREYSAPSQAIGE